MLGSGSADHHIMPTSSAEAACWENKEFAGWFGPIDLDPSTESTSFFDLNFDYDQEVFDSSDASIECNFFDDFDLGSTSTAESVLSSANDGPSDSSLRCLHKCSPRPSQETTLAPAPQIQKLVYRLRPEGVAISNADLLSIEGRKQPFMSAGLRPKTPPPTPQNTPGVNTPKTPRTPGEKSSRIHKSMRSPSKAMQPSNYYTMQDKSSAHDWDQRFQRFNLQQNSLPLSPPPSTRIQQGKQPGRIVPASNHTSALAPLLGTTMPTVQMPASAISMPMPTPPLHHPSDHAISPLASWPEESAGMSFSPVSPLLETEWDTNAIANIHNSHFEPYISSDGTDLASQSFGEGGLLIDFGNTQSLDESLASSFPDSYDIQQSPLPSTQTSFTDSQHFQPRSSVNSADPARDFGSRSPTPSPRSRSLRSSRRRTPVHRKTVSADSDSSQSAQRTRSGSGGKCGVTKPGKSGGRAGAGAADMFVNFTPSDSRRILTGVAPSGSSKTKARREKEAQEARRRMSEAARKAIQEAGGNWESLVGELVEA